MNLVKSPGPYTKMQESIIFGLKASRKRDRVWPWTEDSGPITKFNLPVDLQELIIEAICFLTHEYTSILEAVEPDSDDKQYGNGDDEDDDDDDDDDAEHEDQNNILMDLDSGQDEDGHWYVFVFHDSEGTSQAYPLISSATALIKWRWFYMSS